MKNQSLPIVACMVQAAKKLLAGWKSKDPLLLKMFEDFGVISVKKKSPEISKEKIKEIDFIGDYEQHPHDLDS